MSADNWVVCPRCKIDFDAAYQRRVDQVSESYGKVSAAEYLQNLRLVEDKTEIEETFREDYYIGVNSDGVFCVSYRGFCAKCGLTHEYHYNQAIKPFESTPT